MYFDTHELNTKNKVVYNFHRKLMEYGYPTPLEVLGIYDPAIRYYSPYTYRISRMTKAKILCECAKNPWYVLRNIIRSQVGSSKRHVNLTDGELLALMNFIKGGRTVVSAPTMTIKTNLLAIAALMTQPKIILYSGKDADKEILSVMKDYINRMPPYLQEFFNDSLPKLYHVRSFINDSGRVISGYNNSDVIILQDNFEFDPFVSVADMKLLERNRMNFKNPIRHMMTSSVNPALDTDMRNYVNGMSYIRYDNVSRGYGEHNSLLVPVSLKEIFKLRSDKKEIQYYKNILLKYNDNDDELGLFLTR